MMLPALDPARHRTKVVYTLLALLVGMIGGAAIGVPSIAAQSSGPSGKIAYVRGGDIWQWTPSGDALYLQDGSAQTPSWSPDGNELIFTRDGGSFSNLVRYRSETGTRRALTDNESYSEQGSLDYVLGSSWANDPFWSASGIIGFVSDMESQDGEMILWLMNASDEQPYPAATDGTDAGNIEHVTIDATGSFAAYTVLTSDPNAGGTTYVAFRDLNTGITTPIANGATGIYDPDFSPDGESLVVSIRQPGGTSDLWLYDLTSGSLDQLTSGQNATSARWSPDGTWIAYLQPGGNSFEAWAIPINAQRNGGNGNAVKLFSHDDIDAPSGLSWSN